LYKHANVYSGCFGFRGSYSAGGTCVICGSGILSGYGECNQMSAVYVRLFLTAALLYEVWCHTHWSVALALTLLVIGNEFSVLDDNNTSARIAKLEQYKREMK
jgi:hypothetical protein